MPWTSDSAFTGEDTLHQRCTIVGAVGTHGVNLISHLGKKNLSSLNAFDLSLLLLTIFKVDAGQVLELVFGSHGS